MIQDLITLSGIVLTVAIITFASFVRERKRENN